MQTSEMAKQIIGLQKIIFNGTFDALVLLQGQAEVINDHWTEKLGVSPEQKKAINKWRGHLKKGRDDFKKLVDTGFVNLEEMVTAPTAGEAAATKKPI